MTRTMTVKKMRFTDAQREKLVERFGATAKGMQFIGDLLKIVTGHMGMKQAGDGVPTAAVIRSNASAIQKAAKQLAKCVADLEDGEKELLGQLMWTVDRQRYYPRGFSVDQLTQSVQVLEQAARKLAQGGREGGRPRLQQDGLIRDVHAAYVVRFNRSPELSMAKDNDHTFALKVCLEAIGERPKALRQLMHDALVA